MNVGSVFFFLCAAVCVLGALATVAARNPIRSAVGLLATIMGIAGLFLKLQAQFLAAIQLIVYAGAVVVLFVFVIMLLGPDADAGHSVSAPEPSGRLARSFSFVVVVGMLITALSLLVSASEQPTPFRPVSRAHGSVEAVGALLFSKGLVPFELATVLLIVAVVGAIAIARSRPAKKRPEGIRSPTRRMFHGPLVPRDVGRPLGKNGSLGKDAAQ